MLNKRLDSIFLRDAALLSLAALVSVLPALFFQLVPGYMDAEYYYAGAVNLFQGHGYFENYVWNTLNLPVSLPAASHVYWMPLPSILADLGMRLFNSRSYLDARYVTLVMSLFIPVVCYGFAYRISQQRRIGRIAGGFAVLSGVYLVYTNLVEAFTPYMLFGGLILVLAWLAFRTSSDQPWKLNIQFFCMGLLSGLMHLTRADGILWIGFAAFLLVFLIWQHKQWKPFLLPLILLVVGYFIIMSPWYFRNIQLYGWIFPPGNQYTLFLTGYNDNFLYPASQITMQRWLESGWQTILMDRVQAVGANLLTAWMIQFEIVLLPFFVIWIRAHWKENYIRWLLLCYVLQLILMSIIFPYAGMRGGFFHSGSAFQVIFWVGSAVGLDAAIKKLMDKRPYLDRRIPGMLYGGVIMILAIITGMLYRQKVFGKENDLQNWQRGYVAYVQLNRALLANGIDADQGVMVNNPPGFYLASGRNAVVVPNAPIKGVVNLARKFDIQYVILDTHIVPALTDVYENHMSTDDVTYLFSSGEFNIYQIRGQE